jgi:hypothetical protein
VIIEACDKPTPHPNIQRLAIDNCDPIDKIDIQNVCWG